MFTQEGLEEKELCRPPVKGCRCVYCAGIPSRKGSHNFKASCGECSAASHTYAGGDERHNPENIARLALKAIVTPEEFKEYVAQPGGAEVLFQGPSGLWYLTGRYLFGHSVAVYLERQPTWKLARPFATLCIPPVKDGLPLAACVLTHYLALKHQEGETWQVDNENERYFEIACVKLTAHNAAKARAVPK